MRTAVSPRNRVSFVRVPVIFLLVLFLVHATRSGLPPVHSASSPASTVHYVAPGGACMGQTPCYGSVQAAVDAASGDDVIKIAAGTYSDVHERDGDTQVVYIAKDITLRGGYDAAEGFSDPPLPTTNRTILDAQEQGRVVVIIGGAGPVLEGLVITGGAGYHSGGGIWSEFGSAKISNCEIVDNSADYDGGGVWVKSGTMIVSGCDISSNQAVSGAGVRLINNADVILIGNRISENIATGNGGGASIDCCGGATPVVERNLIVANQSGYSGGGVHVYGTNALMVNNVIARNEAVEGAGVGVWANSSWPATVTLKHNTLKGASSGEGVEVTDSVSATLVNNIIVDFALGLSNTTPSSSTIDAQATLFYSNGSNHSTGVTSSGEVVGAPLFRDPGADDYHIKKSSAAIDQGTDAYVDYDLDGQHRPIGSAPDIGADEWGAFLHLPLTLRDG